MLEGFTEDELFNMACDCQKKYEKKEIETLKRHLLARLPQTLRWLKHWKISTESILMRRPTTRILLQT